MPHGDGDNRTVNKWNGGALMRRAAKIDANQPEIVAALRQVGARVQCTHTLGQGFPDLVVAYRGRVVLMEEKVGKAVLTPDESAFWCDWSNQAGDALVVVRSPEEALKAIGAI